MRIHFSKENTDPVLDPPDSSAIDSRRIPPITKRKEPRRILYYDQDILVAVKPAGILSLPGKTESVDFLSYLRSMSPKTFSSWDDPKLVHRLDRPVGGILLFTRSRRAERFYSPDGVKKHMKKTYLALICGSMPENSGTLTDYLLHDGRTNLSKVVTEETEGAQIASLQYEVIRTIEANPEHGVLQLIRIALLTGRHHQIRIQLAHRGCPILGDTKYNETISSENGWQRIALFADSLTIRHPDGEEKIFSADPSVYEPEAFLLLEESAQGEEK